MDLYNWAGIPVEKMTPLLSRQVFHTERMTIARLIITKGAIVPLHHHENEQVSVVDSGTLRFEVDGKETLVRGGEALRIPPNAPHMVEAMEDCIVTALFAPRREDWISGDDSYLRK